MSEISLPESFITKFKKAFSVKQPTSPIIPPEISNDTLPIPAIPNKSIDEQNTPLEAFKREETLVHDVEDAQGTREEEWGNNELHPTKAYYDYHEKGITPPSVPHAEFEHDLISTNPEVSQPTKLMNLKEEAFYQTNPMKEIPAEPKTSK